MSAFDELEKIVEKRLVIDRDSIKQFTFLYKNYISADEFISKLKKIMSDNNNIPVNDINKFINFLLTPGADDKPHMKILGNVSFFSTHCSLVCYILNIITKKYKLCSNHIKNIIDLIEKRSYIYHSFLWVDNLVLLGQTFGKTDIKLLKKYGYDEDLEKFLNRYDQQISLPEKTLDKIFKHGMVELILSDAEITKNVVKNLKNNKFVPSHKYFQSSLSAKDSSYSDTTISVHKMTFQILDFLKLCSYNFTERELFDLILKTNFSHEFGINVNTRKTNPIKLNSDKGEILYAGGNIQALKKKENNYLESVINFFSNNKVKLTLQSVCDEYNSLIYTHYERNSRDYFLASHCVLITMIGILIGMEYVKCSNSEKNTKNVIMMSNILYKKYYDFQDSHSKITQQIVQNLHKTAFAGANIDVKTFNNIDILKMAIAVNQEDLIERFMFDNPMALVKVSDGMKYACTNLNGKLVDFYLDQRTIPTGYHVCCLVIAALRSDDDTFKSKLEKMYDIIDKLCMFGLKIDENVYKILCTVKGIDDKKIVPHLKKLSPETVSKIKKDTKPGKNIVPKHSCKVVKSNNQERNIKEATPQIIKEMFKYSSLPHLLYICELHKFKPTVECIELAYKFNWYPNVFEYYMNELKISGTKDIAESSGHVTLKEIMLYRTENVKYAKDMSTKVRQTESDEESEKNIQLNENPIKKVTKKATKKAAKKVELSINVLESNADVNIVTPILKPDLKLAKELPKKVVKKTSKKEESDEESIKELPKKILKKATKKEESVEDKPKKVIKIKKQPKKEIILDEDSLVDFE